MTELEKELLAEPNSIYQKLVEVEEGELNGGTSIHKKPLKDEFYWDTTYKVTFVAEPQYHLTGSIEVETIKEALAYKERETEIWFDDVNWDETPEEAFQDVSFEDIEVCIDDYALKNPSKEYQEVVKSKQTGNQRKTTLNALTRCLSSSGLHPDEFHILMDEVIEENEEFKSKFNYNHNISKEG